LKVVPTRVSSDGTRRYEVSGLPGAPKEIPGIISNTPHHWGMTGSGSPTITNRKPRVGEGISVNTDAGSIRLKVKTIRADGAMIGVVEILNTNSGKKLDINGIRHGDSVIVRGMDFVTLVHTA
jgi:hypothetical protein